MHLINPCQFDDVERLERQDAKGPIFAVNLHTTLVYRLTNSDQFRHCTHVGRGVFLRVRHAPSQGSEAQYFLFGFPVSISTVFGLERPKSAW